MKEHVNKGNNQGSLHNIFNNNGAIMNLDLNLDDSERFAK